MYNFPKLYDLFCAGLESGRVRGIKRVNHIVPIENLLTVAHEAHFRCEIWFSLVSQAYRHDNSKIANDERFEKHKQFCKLVAKERRENATNAFNHRNSQQHNDNDANSNSSSEDDTGVDNQFY